MYYTPAEYHRRRGRMQATMHKVVPDSKNYVVCDLYKECPTSMLRVTSCNGGTTFRVDIVFFVGEEVHWSNDLESGTAEDAFRMVAMRFQPMT